MPEVALETRRKVFRDIINGHPINLIAERHDLSLNTIRKLLPQAERIRTKLVEDGKISPNAPIPQYISGTGKEDSVISIVTPDSASAPRKVQVVDVIAPVAFTKTGADGLPVSTRTFDSNARKDLVDQGLTKALEILPEIANPRELQYWASAVSLLIDRRRMEDGEATQRVEVSDTRRLLEQKLRGLHERRKELQEGEKTNPLPTPTPLRAVNQ